MSVLPVANDKVQLTSSAGTNYQNGVLMSGASAVYATSSPSVWSNGIYRTADGAIYVFNATAGMPSGFTWSNGLPFSALGALCVSTNAVASWSNGIPFDANGAVVADFGMPVPALSLNFTSGTLDSRITFTRASGATYTDSSGVIQLATSNTPRFDYDPVTLQPKGLLIEEQRTNLLLNSDTLSTQNVTVTAVATTLSFYGTGTVAILGVGTGTLVGTGAYPNRVSLTFTPTAGTLTLTVTGSVRQAQLEAGSFATSYIPTTTAQATRAADVAVMTGTNFSSWYNQSEGTVFTEVDSIATTLANYPVCFEASDGTSSNVVAIGTNSFFNARVYMRSGGVNQVDMYAGSTTAGIPPNTMTKIAYGVKLNDVAATRAGETPSTDAIATMPISATQAKIGGSVYLGQWNGHIKSIAYYNTRLSNTQLQTLTT